MKLIMTKGLPGSGKSTWAKEQLKKGGYKRVNKDDLRRMLDDGKWSGKNEDFVLEVRDSIITDAFHNGYNVIVDDTNLHPKHEETLRRIAKDAKIVYGFDVQFEIKDFTDVPIEECIKRDLQRLESVGERVIRKMYNDFLAPKYDPPIWNDKLPYAIICDLDGTLALFGNANPYNRDFLQDKLNMPVQEILRAMYRYEGSPYIILLSGREGKFKDMTIEWLQKNEVWYESLYMRAEGDLRNDAIIKEELYREHIEGKYNVLFVLDDRNRVVDLWRRLGLTCLQVADGDF